MSQRLAIVTGAGKGLGRVLCFQLIKRGYAVAALSRSAADLELLAREVQAISPASTGMLSTHAVELTDERAVASVFAAVSAWIPAAPVLLVNNAGTWTGGISAEDLTPELFMASFEANFLSAVRCSRETLQLWRGAGSSSTLAIVNVGATASLRGGKRTAAFAVAKGALRLYSQSMARELGPSGVHVAHLVIDGLIDNERTRRLNPSLDPSRFLSPAAIAASIVDVSEQEASAWTFEWELRPSNEPW